MLMSENHEEKSVPFYPDHIKSEAIVALVVGVIILLVGLVGLFFPVGLGAPADPMDTPEHIKPEWYFLSLYQLLRYIPETIGAILPVVAVLILAIWPFLDSKADQDKKGFWIRFWIAVVAVVVIVALTIWGEVS
jgi:quinol-cytochrome oxidoreductase complex cytochrome b subunit